MDTVNIVKFECLVTVGKDAQVDFDLCSHVGVTHPVHDRIFDAVLLFVSTGVKTLYHLPPAVYRLTIQYHAEPTADCVDQSCVEICLSNKDDPESEVYIPSIEQCVAQIKADISLEDAVRINKYRTR